MERFNANSYYAKKYESATPNVKKWFGFEYVYSLHPDEQIGLDAEMEMRKIEQSFDDKDWETLIGLTDNQIAKSVYRKRKNGEKIYGDAVLNVKYREDA